MMVCVMLVCAQMPDQWPDQALGAFDQGQRYGLGPVTPDHSLIIIALHKPNVCQKAAKPNVCQQASRRAPDVGGTPFQR